MNTISTKKSSRFEDFAKYRSTLPSTNSGIQPISGNSHNFIDANNHQMKSNALILKSVVTKNDAKFIKQVANDRAKANETFIITQRSKSLKLNQNLSTKFYPTSTNARQMSSTQLPSRHYVAPEGQGFMDNLMALIYNRKLSSIDFLSVSFFISGIALMIFLIHLS